MAHRKIDEIEGIGPAFGRSLRSAGVSDTDTLLEKGCDAAGRRELSQKTGISEAKILDWVNMADLFRIRGIGPEFAELLEAAGVDTVKELATRNPENLAEKCHQVNDEKKLTRRVPTPDVVKGWIEQAASLPAKVHH